MIAFNSEKVKEMIENKIYHPYVQRHLDRPFIDLDKIATLLMIYDEVALNQQHKYDEIVSIMLVQTALDTHDLVTNKSIEANDELTRQLHVLAGDFYSGLYYRTLAEINEIALVQTLANAIKQVNEQKMLLYQYELKNWNELIKTIQVVESILFTNVGQLYGLADINVQYMNEYLLVNRLLKEIEAIEASEYNHINEYVHRNLVEITEQSVICAIEKEIENRHQNMEMLKRKSAFTFKTLTHNCYNKAILSAVEEG